MLNIQPVKFSAADGHNNSETQFVEKEEIDTHTWEVVQNSTVTSDAVILQNENLGHVESCSFSPAYNPNDSSDRVHRGSTYKGG